jgi:hypothetical protein
MAVGFKLFAIAIFATILTLVTFTVLWHVEEKLKLVLKDGVLPGNNDDEDDNNGSTNGNTNGNGDTDLGGIGTR